MTPTWRESMTFGSGIRCSTNWAKKSCGWLSVQCAVHVLLTSKRQEAGKRMYSTTAMYRSTSELLVHNKDYTQIECMTKQTIHAIVLNMILRQPGIEPGANRWQRFILPLNHWRHILLTLGRFYTVQYLWAHTYQHTHTHKHILSHTSPIPIDLTKQPHHLEVYLQPCHDSPTVLVKTHCYTHTLEPTHHYHMAWASHVKDHQVKVCTLELPDITGPGIIICCGPSTCIQSCCLIPWLRFCLMC